MGEVNSFLNRARVFLIVDHPSMEQGLVSLIDGENDLSVCGVAINQRNGVMEHIELLRPDLVLAELHLNGGERVELIQRIRERYPAIPLLALTVYGDSVYHSRILEAGADAHVCEPEKGKVVLQTIRRLLKRTAHHGFQSGE